MTSPETPITGIPRTGVPEVIGQLREDETLSKTDLIEVIAQCASVTATAQFRMLQAISLIHEEHEEDYGVDLAAQTTGATDSVENFRDLAACAGSGGNPHADFGPDGLERTIADVGAVLSVSPAKARELIVSAHALRYRLPHTAAALACGRIDLHRFLIAVRRTSLCTPAHLVDVDTRLAETLFARDHMSLMRFTALIDATVARMDPAAVRRRHRLVEHDRAIVIRPDRFTPGQSRLSGYLPVASSVVIDARLTALAEGVHAADPRSTQQRRADALVALAAGRTAIECRCPECAAANDSGESAPLPASTRVIHVVANQSTIDGVDDAAGYLDGYGVIDAQTVRELMVDAEIQTIAPDHHASARSALTYAPSRKLAALIRCGELCCVFPGCGNPVWHADLDHTEPFNHHSPDNGGKTMRHNMKPLCRFHHRMKTFSAWRDYQLGLCTSLFVSPTGHTFIGNAFTGLDLFPKLLAHKPPDHPSRRHIEQIHTDRRAQATRTQHRHDAAGPPPF
ncbi:MAG: DUF222 domain-containing protein [Gordonia sp. (in: high G+C Gram-positive bacteria)]